MTLPRLATGRSRAKGIEVSSRCGPVGRRTFVERPPDLGPRRRSRWCSGRRDGAGTPRDSGVESRAPGGVARRVFVLRTRRYFAGFAVFACFGFLGFLAFLSTRLSPQGQGPDAAE